MSEVLRLRQVWRLGDRIGSGGFGQVFAAKSMAGEIAVAKLVPKAAGAERELLFVDLAGIRNIVPVIDSGETDDAWVIVMPQAEKSLRQHLEEAAGPLAVPDVVAVLSDIAATLVDLDGKVVHRDLKPENVLYLDGHWCLADFGISRYAEATTAPDTRKYAMSAPYAAPERWRNERATIATDIYSLGVIAYELLSSARPFAGAAMHDLREQHLHVAPRHLTSIPAPLGTLVEACLYKAPEARPSPNDVAARLARITEQAPSAGRVKLEEADRAEVVRLGESARRESASRTEAERRAALYDAATTSLVRIADTLKEAVMQTATSASIQQRRDGSWSIQLNQAVLTFTSATRTAPEPWGSWPPPAFEVVAHATVGIRILADRYEYEGRAHALWFCDAQEQDRFRWFETAFMVSPFISERGRQDPFALDPGEESAKAVWNGMAEWQVAWPFTLLSIGDLEEFVNRWVEWFADAAQGQLGHPSRMPERPPDGSWRRS